MDKIRSVLLLVLLSLILGLPDFTIAQESKTLDDQTKLIRIKKIATEWTGSILTLKTRDGEKIHGRLVEVQGENYHMEYGGAVVQIPVKDVIMVSFEPGTAEALLSFASAFMGAAFLSGAMVLAQKDATSSQISISALIGLLGGGLWGYSTFYESEVIYLE